MEELWKPIIGYEGLYEVSNFGNIKSLSKVHHLGAKNQYISQERLLTLSIQKCHFNYKRYRVNLWANDKAKMFKVHRLVAQAFIPNPENKPQVNHIDNNPLNNNVSNLEWVTNRENLDHCLKQGRFNRGSNNGMSKLNEQKVLEIRELIKTKDKDYLVKKYKVAKTTITSVLNRTVWKHI